LIEVNIADPVIGLPTQDGAHLGIDSSQVGITPLLCDSANQDVVPAAAAHFCLNAHKGIHHSRIGAVQDHGTLLTQKPAAFTGFEGGKFQVVLTPATRHCCTSR
jgi:hypothetical protein